MEAILPNFRELIRGDELIVAPCALNPIMARIAEDAGFKAVYMSGGSLGWLKCVTEANVTLPEMAEIAVDIRAVCRLPIILDAGGGWGDPMHVHRTIALTEAAGFSAIEIEDQLLPRRVEHHIGIDNLVDTGLMVDKIKEAIAARTDPNLVIIARTNTRRVHGLDDALRRGEAFHRAGADMLFIYTRDAEEMRFVGERLPAPLMTFAPPDGFATFALSQSDLFRLGYRAAASSGTSFAAMYKAVRQSMECLAENRLDPFLGPGGAEMEMKRSHQTSRLDRLLEVERRTMKGR
jgi:methylisocitrate lyase